MADAGGIAGQHDLSAPGKPVDTGLGCLGLVLAIAGEAFDVERARRDYLAPGRVADSDDLLRIARGAGTVQGLKIHTPGAVVTTADTLMTIVPDGTGIEVDSLVLNKDIGFVQEGQDVEDVEVKLEAFPFTRYGLVRGRVRKLGRDAATSPNAPPGGSAALMASQPTSGPAGAAPAELAYPAKVTLLQDWIAVDGRREPIRPGMRVTAEVKTGDRRVIEYLLSPAMQAAHEAGRER